MNASLPRIITHACLTVGILLIGVAIFNGDGKPAVDTGTGKRPSAQKAAVYDAAIHPEALPGSKAPADTLLPLGESIKSYVDANDPDSSVYIEDLKTDTAVHVGETRAYNIKSLMKVPLVMSMHKAEDLKRLDPDAKYPLQASDLDRDFGELWKKGEGHMISLHEAAVLALKYSDNTAIRFINSHVFKVMKSDERAYKTLKLDMRVVDGESFVTTESYATVFRCLYRSCYNTKAHSDEILQLLSQTEFRAPYRLLPGDAIVSHKIGNLGREGFNDCGIVYGRKSTFIFCMMLTQPEPKASEDIAHIVKLAYDHLER